MKTVLNKVDIIVKLKEKIAEAKASNDVLAERLQKLLDEVIQTNTKTPAI